MFKHILLLLVVRQITCNTSASVADCDGRLCANNTSSDGIREEASNSWLMNIVKSSFGSFSNVVYHISKNNVQISPLISEDEFVNSYQCWKKLYISEVNLTKSYYENFASYLNKSPEIKNRTEVAMLLTHIYRQTRGFDRTANWCAFQKCVFQNETNTIVNYNGRGYIHLYGEDNYGSASYDLFGNDILLKNPDLVATNETIAWQTAFWFWMKFVHSVAISGLFGATIPLIWGEQPCNDPQYKAKFDKLFQLHICVLETMNISEIPSRDGCFILSEPLTTFTNNTSVKTSVAVYIITPISIVIFSIITIVIVLYIRQRKQKNEIGLSLLNQFVMTEKNLEDIGYKPDYEFPSNRLIMKEELGSGFFGVVFKAKAIGLQTSNGDIATVAVKKVKERFDSAHQASLLSELKIFLSLGKHLNIINFLGAVTKGELMLIFEYCEYGNIRDFLVAHRDNFVNQLNPETSEYDKSINSDILKLSENEELKTHELICYSYQISQGMEYLSARSILHRDLAARNILLTKGNIIKLCDFGLSKDVYHYGDYCTTSNKQMPIKWMSVEAVRDRIFTTKNDIWAFGVVLWEIFSLGCDPYPGKQIDEQFLNNIINGYRMDRPEYCPKTVYTLMKACWEIDPNNRPHFDVLTGGLRNILDESTQNYYLQLNDNYVKFSKIGDIEANKSYTNEIYTSVNEAFEIA